MKKTNLSIHGSDGSNHGLDVNELNKGIVGLLYVYLEYFAELLEPLVDLVRNDLSWDISHMKGSSCLRMELTELRIPRPEYILTVKQNSQNIWHIIHIILNREV